MQSALLAEVAAWEGDYQAAAKLWTSAGMGDKVG